jgi:electron transfer flavoprotein alpha subunit
MNDVWTMAEQYDGKLKGISFELLARGRSLADKLGVQLVSVLFGDGVSDADLQQLIKQGADEVYYVKDPLLKDFVCNTYANTLIRLIKEKKPQICISGATTAGRTMMPYAAVRIPTGLTADCTGLDIEQGTNNLLQTRPAIGGNILATIKTPNHRPQMATVRPKSTIPLKPDANRKGKVTVIPFNKDDLDTRVKVTGLRKEEGNTVNLESADYICSGGKGFKKSDNWHILEELAGAVGAQVGASRDVVDRGWVPYAHQVGLSGKTVSPKVYMAIGISGAIQHLAGIKTSESIVAINTNPDANIFGVADLCIVGDLFQVVPELTKRIKAKRAAKGGK